MKLGQGDIYSSVLQLGQQNSQFSQGPSSQHLLTDCKINSVNIHLIFLMFVFLCALQDTKINANRSGSPSVVSST